MQDLRSIPLGRSGWLVNVYFHLVWA